MIRFAWQKRQSKRERCGSVLRRLLMYRLWCVPRHRARELHPFRREQLFVCVQAAGNWRREESVWRSLDVLSGWSDREWWWVKQKRNHLWFENWDLIFENSWYHRLHVGGTSISTYTQHHRHFDALANGSWPAQFDHHSQARKGSSDQVAIQYRSR